MLDRSPGRPLEGMLRFDLAAIAVLEALQLNSRPLSVKILLTWNGKNARHCFRKSVAAFLSLCS